MVSLKQIIDWIAGVESVTTSPTPKQKRTHRYKNRAELREHVVVTKDADKYIVYTYDVVDHRMPTAEDRKMCFVYKDKCKAIAAARHLIRNLHSTQEHPALVF